VIEITRVYVDMVADLFHYGHVNFLKQAKSHGDFLLVGIHADETVESYKRTPILTMEERIASVSGCRYVDEVIPNAPLEITREWIEKNQIELIIHGDDVAPEVRDTWYKVPIEMGIYQSVSYTEGISTTELIARIKAADLE
jgi:cytidyltransferase-like protein